MRFFSSFDPLVYTRRLFGLVLLGESIRFWVHGWISEYYIEPAFHFFYSGFSFIQVLPGNWMYVVFVLLGVSGGLIASNKWWRIGLIGGLLSFGYIFLIDPAYYNNHYYLYLLLGFVFWFESLWLTQFTIALPYVFGAVAKMNMDWLTGWPVRLWYDVSEWAVYVLSYGGLLFDLFIVPMLMWRKTRLLGVILAAFFHIYNAIQFEIGLFPWFMLLALPVFFVIERPVLPLDAWRRTLIGGFIVLQCCLPFRHLLIPGTVYWTTEGRRFSWHMKTVNKSGTIQFFLPQDDSIEPFSPSPYDELHPFQVSVMSKHPQMILQYAHHLAELYDVDEVYVLALIALNGREKQLLIDPQINLVQEAWEFGHHPWVLPLTSERVSP